MRVIVKEVLVQCIVRGMSERSLFKGEKIFEFVKIHKT